MVTLTYRIDDGPLQTFTSELDDPGAAQLDLIMAQDLGDSPWIMDVWIGQDADTAQPPNFRHQHQAEAVTQ